MYGMICERKKMRWVSKWTLDIVKLVRGDLFGEYLVKRGEEEGVEQLGGWVELGLTNILQQRTCLYYCCSLLYKG